MIDFNALFSDAPRTPEAQVAWLEQLKNRLRTANDPGVRRLVASVDEALHTLTSRPDEATARIAVAELQLELLGRALHASLETATVLHKTATKELERAEPARRAALQVSIQASAKLVSGLLRVCEQLQEGNVEEAPSGVRLIAEAREELEHAAQLQARS